ncbi:MAG: TetR/AcrR family transcriptional regulator [Paracoccaceae bacterium]
MTPQPTSPEPKAPPEQILDAAAVCFMERGYSGASLDDVARHMGATKGRIYHYFDSKSDLLHAIRKWAMNKNFAAVRPAYASDLAPYEKFHRMAKAHALSILSERAYQKALLDSLHLHITQGLAGPAGGELDEFLGTRRRFEDMFREVLNAGIQSGAFHVKNVSFALHTVLSLLNSTLYWYTPRLGEPSDTKQEIADQLADMALGALGAHRKSPDERNPQ